MTGYAKHTAISIDVLGLGAGEGKEGEPLIAQGLDLWVLATGLRYDIRL